LTPIQRALGERRVLALDYQGGKRTDLTKRLVEPLGLVYYSDNWHLIAYCRLRRDVRDFRTDRIVKLVLHNELFSGHSDFSLKSYLEAERYRGKFEMARIRLPKRKELPLNTRFLARLGHRSRAFRKTACPEVRADANSTFRKSPDIGLSVAWVRVWRLLRRIIAAKAQKRQPNQANYEQHDKV
jgi:hypothetical protein